MRKHTVIMIPSDALLAGQPKRASFVREEAPAPDEEVTGGMVVVVAVVVLRAVVF